MSGRPHRRITAKEKEENKLSHRKCTYVYADLEDDDKGGKRLRRCRRSTGKNFFFCKEHLSHISDFGVVGI